MFITIFLVALFMVALISVALTLSSRARGVAKSRALELGRLTGISADDIYDELRRTRQTPAQWAKAHDLDPSTLQPATIEAAELAFWVKVRRDPSAEIPAQQDLARLKSMHNEFSIAAPGSERRREIENEAKALGARFEDD